MMRCIRIALALAAALQTVSPLHNGGAAAFPAAAESNLDNDLVTTAKIQTTADCINHMQGYRSAIRFLQKRLVSSPASVTVRLSGGDSVTLLNRHHVRLQSHVRLLQRGMLSKEFSCQRALVTSKRTAP